MYVFKYLGSRSIDGYCLFLRRCGYTAYVEMRDGFAHLITDKGDAGGLNWQWIGREVK